MEFYRIEKDGHGPYNPSSGTPPITEFLEKSWGINYKNIKGRLSKYLEKRPTAYDDKKIAHFFYEFTKNKKDLYVYGFESLDKLLAWFDEYDQMQFLKDFEYTLNVYETEDYCISDYQMIANRTSLKLKESITL